MYCRSKTSLRITSRHHVPTEVKKSVTFSDKPVSVTSAAVTDERPPEPEEGDVKVVETTAVDTSQFRDLYTVRRLEQTVPRDMPD